MQEKLNAQEEKPGAQRRRYARCVRPSTPDKRPSANSSPHGGSVKHDRKKTHMVCRGERQ